MTERGNEARLLRPFGRGWDGASAEQQVVTISVGVARMTRWAPGTAPDGYTWLRAADEAMYASKARGRNRVTVAPERLQAQSRVA